jgi:DNA-binding SARP family transcriptional activator/DNA-binding beta-propeller fold protein YncE/ABC-type branched-subunit amino acid transport system substrate-binding protein
VEFRLLGLLEVQADGGLVPIVRGRESALLALLLVHTNEPLSIDRVVEELWGDAAPENAVKSVHIYVSRLRKALGADRIETTPAGYRLRVAVDELDVNRFERLAADGRAALDADDVEGAEAACDDALGLWRGEALGDFRFDGFAQSEIRRLEELRDATIADRADARIARGQAAQVVRELETLIERAPLWERPRAQLMRALYLAGRQADALELYRQTRELLDDELGIEPGPQLQALERAILNQDAELGVPASPPRNLPRRRSFRLLLAGGLLITIAAVLAAVVLARSRGDSLQSIQSNAVVGIDPSTNRVVAQIAAGNRPSRLAADGGRLWVMNTGDGTITQIDPVHARRVATFGTASVPTDIGATSNALWVGNAFPRGARFALGGIEEPGSISRFDAVQRTRLSVALLPHDHVEPFSGRPPEERLLVTGGGAVWAIGPALEPVELNASTGRVVRVVHIPASSLAYGDGSLWVLDAKTVSRVDPHNGTVVQQIEIPSLFDLGGIAAGGGRVWVTSSFEGLLWRIDPGPPLAVRSVALTFGASTIAYGDGAVWVGNTVDDSIDRVDPQTDVVKKVATIPSPQDIAVDERRVWVASGSTAGRHGPIASAACGPVYGGKGAPDVLIASDFALQDGELAITQPAEKTVELVLRAHAYRAGRFRVGYQSCNDATQAAGGYDIGQCIANASAFAVDQTVLGVIGTSDSSCAIGEIPITNRAPHGPLAMISPLNTGPFLTRRGPGAAAAALGQFYAAGPRNYTRTIGADHIQIAADAVLAKQLGVRRVGVVFNRYGLVSPEEELWLAYAARRIGGLRVVPLLWNGSQPELAAAVTRSAVDGVVLTGAVTQGLDQAASTVATLRRALGPRKPVIVTDWVAPWPALGPAGAGVYATLAGLTIASQLSPRDRALLAQLPRKLRVPYSVATTAEATESLLAAIAASDGTRRSVVRALLARKGVDRFGDPRTAPVTVFRLRAGARNATGLSFFQGADVDRVVTPPPSAVAPG